MINIIAVILLILVLYGLDKIERILNIVLRIEYEICIKNHYNGEEDILGKCVCAETYSRNCPVHDKGEMK